MIKITILGALSLFTCLTAFADYEDCKNEASGSTSAEHFQSEDSPVGGFGPEGEFRWEKYPRPPFSSFRYAPKYVPAAKSSGTAGNDTQSRMTQVLDAKKEFNERLKERRKKDAYLAQIRPLIERLKKELVQVKKDETRFLTENLEFVEKRIGKLTHAIGDVEISAYCLERLDQIEQEKRNPPKGSSDESVLEKEKTRLEYDVQFHQWRADRFREIAHQVKDEYESIRMKHHSLWTTQIKKKWKATKDSLSKSPRSHDIQETPFDPSNPSDLIELKEFAQKMITDPKNIESKGVRTFLGHLLERSVAQYMKQTQQGSPLSFKRTPLMDSEALLKNWAEVEQGELVPVMEGEEQGALIPVMDGDYRVPPAFAALGPKNMYQVGNLIWSAVPKLQEVEGRGLFGKRIMRRVGGEMTYRKSKRFCKDLGGGSRLPTAEEYSALIRAMTLNGHYDHTRIADMSNDLFWSSTLVVLSRPPCTLGSVFSGVEGTFRMTYRGHDVGHRHLIRCVVDF